MPCAPATPTCADQTGRWQLTLQGPFLRLPVQDFKFALLGMPEELRRSHFLEVQARHAEGKAALACRWVARVLGKQ